MLYSLACLGFIFLAGFQMYMQIGWILQEKQTTIL